MIRLVARIYSHRHDPAHNNQYNSTQTSVFHEILQSDLPEHEKTPTRLWQDGLRLSSGISTRLQRIATEETLIFTTKYPGGIDDEKTYTLHPGIPLSMTGLLIHHSPTYFDDPMAFWPQRWLEEEKKDKSLDKYFVPFSRGTRSCVGINLAYAELYLTIATVFGRYGSKDVHSPNDRGWLELYKTSRRDLDIVGDGATPLYRVGTKGVVIKVHSTD